VAFGGAQAVSIRMATKINAYLLFDPIRNPSFNISEKLSGQSIFDFINQDALDLI
jgi:hypothetical protein